MHIMLLLRANAIVENQPTKSLTHQKFERGFNNSKCFPVVAV